MKKTLCGALVAIMLLCLTACGGSSKAGHYDFYSMEMGGSTITAESLKDLGADYEMYIELKEDGTGTMATDGETVEMAWKDDQIWPADDPDDKVTFEVDGDTLTMEQDGAKLVFKK